MSDFKTEYPVLYFNEYFRRKPMRLNERESEELFTLEQTDVNNFEYISLHDHEKEIASLNDRLAAQVIQVLAYKILVSELDGEIASLKEQLEESSSLVKDSFEIICMTCTKRSNIDNRIKVQAWLKKARVTQARREK